MPRKNRLFIQGLPHLVELRGHNAEPLFRGAEDYRHFLSVLDKAIALFHVKLYAYTLVPERILLFLGAADKDAMSRFIQYIGRCYVSGYNSRYSRRGALWESRYASSPIEPEAYFLLVKKYIEHINRGEAGCQSFADAPRSRISEHPCWQQLGATPELRLRQYQYFCQRPLSLAVTERIRTALRQNCLLATPQYGQSLENVLARPLRPHPQGRPRKHYHNPVAAWTWLEKQASQILQRYCYREIRMPLLERWEAELTPGLFSGDYGAAPLNHQALLRGDGSMGCLRAIAQNEDLMRTSKLWYQGTLFRRDRAASDELRPFYQLGVEAFGYPNIDIELELVLMQAAFFRSLNLLDHVELVINNLGSAEELARFRQALRQYYEPLASLFSDEQRQQLQRQPERLLASSDPFLREIAKRAPSHHDFLSEASTARFSSLCSLLEQAGLPFTLNRALFPANDYCHLVFEWRSDRLQASSAPLCRGGRYDDSASRLVGSPVHACGFALMIEPIMHLLLHTRQTQSLSKHVDVAIIPTQPRGHHRALALGHALREHYPMLSIVSDFSGLRSSVCQKNAERQGARFLLIIEGDENELTFIDRREKQARLLASESVISALGSALML